MFHGAGGALFKMHLMNLVLTVLTLGGYYWKGKVDLRRYLYGQSSFLGDRFVYHGTAMELFKGWLKVAGIFVVVFVGFAVLALMRAGPIYEALYQLFITLVFALLLPFAIVGANRYRLSRTSWRGVRFSFHGTAKQFFGLYLSGTLLTMVTLGLYLPVYAIRINEFFVTNTAFGSERFTFERPPAGPLIKKFALMAFLAFFTFGLSLFWYRAALDRALWNNTGIAGAKFECVSTGRGLLGLMYGNYILTTFTLGLGKPWATVRNLRFLSTNLKLTGRPQLAGIVQQARSASASGEGLGDFLGGEALDFGVGL